MTNLGCTVDNCVYNANQHCKKDEVLVKGRNAHKTSDTCCDSFCDKIDASCSNCRKFGLMPDAYGYIGIGMEYILWIG